MIRIKVMLILLLLSLPLFSEDDKTNEKIDKKQEELEAKKSQIKTLDKEIAKLKKQERELSQNKRMTEREKAKEAKRLKQLIDDKIYLKNNITWLTGEESKHKEELKVTNAKKRETGRNLTNLISSYEQEFLDLFFLSVSDKDTDSMRKQVLIKALMTCQEDIIFEHDENYVSTLKKIEEENRKLNDVKNNLEKKKELQKDREERYVKRKEKTDKLDSEIKDLAKKESKISSEKNKLLTEKEKLEKEALALENFIAELLAAQGDIDKSKLVKSIAIKRPCQGKIVKNFGEKLNELSKVKNKGINYRTTPGSQIKAVYAGKVIYSGHIKSKGQVIIIDHDNGFVSVYAYNSKLNVSKEDIVKQGDVIGISGTDSSGTPMAYFELRRENKPVNPNLFFQN